LRDVAVNAGVDSYRIDRVDELRAEWLSGKSRIGVTGGASAPDVLVREVVARLKELGAASVRDVSITDETVTFPMPKGFSREKSSLATLTPDDAKKMTSPALPGRNLTARLPARHAMQVAQPA
jgi:4-hydroxy-3-methylbut-2-enyl diphosphate reductase